MKGRGTPPDAGALPGLLLIVDRASTGRWDRRSQESPVRRARQVPTARALQARASASRTVDSAKHPVERPAGWWWRSQCLRFRWTMVRGAWTPTCLYGRPECQGCDSAHLEPDARNEGDSRKAQKKKATTILMTASTVRGEGLVTTDPERGHLAPRMEASMGCAPWTRVVSGVHRQKAEQRTEW